MPSITRSSLKLTGGTELSYLMAGDARHPAILLLHGFPSSANTFRDIIPVLAQVAYVIAPDLPGYGRSDVLRSVTFDACAAAVTELLDHLHVGDRYVYLHDYGAPVGFRIAMDHPEQVRGLIVQNANAHRTGFGPQWKDTLAFWSHPDRENEAAATAHLTPEGTRDQYVAGVPDDVARKIDPSVWKEDWRVMALPGRLAAQRSLIADYGNYVARFDAISGYLRKYQPPALLVWGRHDAFFDLAETRSWMEDLPRMEAHILDGGHLLLETHAASAAARMKEFIERTNDVHLAREPIAVFQDHLPQVAGVPLINDGIIKWSYFALPSPTPCVRSFWPHSCSRASWPARRRKTIPCPASRGWSCPRMKP